ncbi:MAG: CGNR zinc finger domain-containing protein [Blastocatellia bacterium]
MAKEGAQAASFLFVGNYTCIDFVNSSIMSDGQSVDLLPSFDHLAQWVMEAELFEPRAGAAARERWRDTDASKSILIQAKELRSAITLAVGRLGAGKGPGRNAVRLANGLLRQQTGYSEIVLAKGKYDRRFHSLLAEPVHLILPIAESFADLLCYADPSLIKKCERPACLLYFYDSTRNHARRWCQMSTCGNRAKAAAHYRRRREAGS